MTYTNHLSRCLTPVDLADVGMLTSADPTRCVITGQWTAPDRLDWEVRCGFERVIHQTGHLIVIDGGHARRETAMSIDGMPSSSGSFEMKRGGTCTPQVSLP